MYFLAEEKNVKVMGRSLYHDQIRYLGYSGSGVSFRFKGKCAKALLVSDVERWPENNYAWMAVFINDEKEPYKRFAVSEKEQLVTLYESSQEETVTVTLVKFTEAAFATCGIKKLEIDSDSLLEPPAAKKRKIVMIGDSITCGYGVDGKVTDEDVDTAKENLAEAYSWLTGTMLDADFQLVSWNGMGVISNYIGDDVNEPDNGWVMPVIYPYTDAACSRDVLKQPKEQWEKWDFSKFQPDVITIYMGTNDASYTREIPERNEEFKNGYIKFVEYVTKQMPGAPVICMLGNMDQRLCDTLKETVEAYKTKHPETNISYLRLNEQEEADGLGTFWHPTAITHAKTAKTVVECIKEVVHW